MAQIVRTALISVFDKTGVVAFAEKLERLGIIIYASGGTAKKLEGEGISVIDVAELVGGAAILGHRVVTLSREVHAGLLAQYMDADINELESLGIPMIDLVYNNCYPLPEEIAKAESTLESVIECTDIGGPTMLRSAAKGNRLVVHDPADLEPVLAYIKNGVEDTDYVNYLAAKAEYYVAGYVMASAIYRGNGRYQGFAGELDRMCKYGENGPQSAGLFKMTNDNPLAIHNFIEIDDRPIGYNGYCDMDRMLHTLRRVATGLKQNFPGHDTPCISIAVKHGNPCGAAFGDISTDVIDDMVIGDMRAIFGGFVITNFEMDAREVESLLFTGTGESGKARMLHGIAAPAFTQDAIELLEEESGCFIVVNEALGTEAICSLSAEDRFRQVEGGFLIQDPYSYVIDFQGNVTMNTELSDKQKTNQVFAWAIGSSSNSNTVTLVNGNKLIGNGVGQQDRVSCCQLAVKKAIDAGHREDIEGAVAYSDSFFPFTDGPEVLIEAEVKTIFTSSGSVKDEEVIAYCENAGITICMIPDKEGRGFWGH